MKDLFAKFYRFLVSCELNHKKNEYKKNKNVLLGENVSIYSSTKIEASNENSIVVGDNTIIRGRLVTFPIGGLIQIGDYSYIGENTQIWSEKKIIIGNHVMIAHNCNIFDSSTHPISYLERRDQYSKIINSGFPVDKYDSLKYGEVLIDDDAWIGCNTTILRGVHIGKRSIISAGSVVTSDIPENVIAAGNPARVIKTIDYNEKSLSD